MKLDPESQFVPNFANISEILESFQLELSTFELAKSGIENCTVIVTCSTSQYVLRVYRQDKKTEQDIILETAFVEYLGSHGIPVATPIFNASGQN